MTSIVCHRGARFRAPENTIASGMAALAQGGHILELDIRQSRDGVPYVLHDATVDRTTDGMGAIADMSSQDIDALDAGAWFAAAFKGVQVPRLSAYLAKLKDRANGFYLDVKDADCAGLAHVLRDQEVIDRCFVGSYNQTFLDDLSHIAPDLRQIVPWERAGRATQPNRSIIAFSSLGDISAVWDAHDVRHAQSRGFETLIRVDSANKARFRTVLSLGMDYAHVDHIAEFDMMQSVSFAARTTGKTARGGLHPLGKGILPCVSSSASEIRAVNTRATATTSALW